MNCREVCPAAVMFGVDGIRVLSASRSPGRVHCGSAGASPWNNLIDNDPTNQILQAWIVKEQLRRLLACAKTGANRTDVSHRLFDFYRWAERSGLPEAVGLAQTVEKWWPQILASIELNISNAGTESTNRQIKTQGRIARGFRNIENQRRRVRYACLPSPRAGHRRGRAMPR